jgi:phosphoglycolate phosphatase
MISIVFDLDGTLVDTSRDMLKAANLCFDEMGYSDVLSEEMHRGTALHGGRAMLTKGLILLKEPDLANVVSEFYPKFLQYYRENLYEKSVFYDGAITCVEKMASKGWNLGICTNKPEDLAKSLLSKMSAQNYFKAIVGVDTLSVRKPDPAPFFETLRLLNGKTNRSCLVGDSITDYSTAKAADVPIILVDFPPNETDMSTLTPDAIINHFDELIPKIENLFLKLK